MPEPPSVETTEVVANPANDRRKRRAFSGKEKLRILAEADACKDRGEAFALLRKEGIYSSHLSDWRRLLRAQGPTGLEAKTPGRKPVRDERDRVIEKLEREMLIARKLIELAGKAHEILGVALPSLEDGEKP